MVLLRFSTLISKVLAKTKTQTIRQRTGHRQKYPLRAGQRLQVYIIFKVGEATIIKTETKQLKELTEEDAKLDGFKDLKELDKALMELHDLDSHDLDNYEKEWDIITFKPEWEPLALIKMDEYPVFPDNDDFLNEVKRRKANIE